jgi:hypothetical protein
VAPAPGDVAGCADEVLPVGVEADSCATLVTLRWNGRSRAAALVSGAVRAVVVSPAAEEVAVGVVGVVGVSGGSLGARLARCRRRRFAAGGWTASGSVRKFQIRPVRSPARAMHTRPGRRVHQKPVLKRRHPHLTTSTSQRRPRVGSILACRKVRKRCRQASVGL